MNMICTTTKPEVFNPKFEGSFCIIENKDGEILLLHRQDWKPEGDTWGIPGGKMDLGETSEQTVKREVFEETKIIVDNIKFLHTFYVRYPDYEFIFHMWRFEAKERCGVEINPKEHKDFCWTTPNRAIKELLLIGGLDKCFEKVYQF